MGVFAGETAVKAQKVSGLHASLWFRTRSAHCSGMLGMEDQQEGEEEEVGGCGEGGENKVERCLGVFASLKSFRRRTHTAVGGGVRGQTG